MLKTARIAKALAQNNISVKNFNKKNKHNFNKKIKHNFNVTLTTYSKKMCKVAPV